MKILAPNTLLQNRYLVVHLIGKGGMGEVYLAVDQRLGSAVALKRTFFTGDETLGNAFEREARILGRLRHPVLPKVSDHFIENEHQYLVMEHITGDDLSKRLELTGKPFPLSWVLFWSDQLLDALNYLHSHEPPIIHRDIKPQNLKLTDENNIILLDFGLSKSSIGDSRLSNPISSDVSGSVVGYTPHYAPMEQIRGTGTSPRSDIYSLSATIYQLLTNTVPPDALTRADSLLNGFADPVKPINEVNAEVNKAVSDVVIKGMSVSQDLRYATAREMQKELRDAYAQLQKAMSAQTVAFNAQESSAEGFSGNTEPIVTGHQSAAAANVVSGNLAKSETDSLSSEEQNNFDETLRYEGEPQQFVQKQSEIKTEVFSGGIVMPEAEVSAPAEKISPEATVPLISFNETEAEKAPSGVDFGLTESKNKDEIPATAMYVPNADVPASEFTFTENAAEEPKTGFTEEFSFTQDFSAAETQFSGGQENTGNYNSQPVPPASVAATANSAAQAQQKSGNRKLLAIFGALGLLLFLGIGAATFGWWYLYGGSDTTEKEKEATPTPMVSATPTPEETLVENNSNTSDNSNSDVANSGNTNTSNDNSNISTELTNTNNNTNSVTQTTKVTTPTPPVQTKTPVPQPTQTTRVNPTPKQTQATTTTTPRQTPNVKTTPKKNDSTVILQ